MSQAVNSTIDERIVEMKFDNKQFESGVKQTMSTLDRLKAALHFDTDTKGIERIQNKVNNFDFSLISRGIDNFQVRLSGLEVFANRIIENIADGVYGAIQKVTHALTGVFRQIDEGGARRAQNIEQAKFQLEGLGIAWDDVKGDIDYAVSGTAYGLDVAAKAASQLVASNVQLGDEMKYSLRGISGLAAMTNSSYEDIADIFTKVAGQGRMMGEDLNRIAARGINAAAELAKAFNTTEAEIRDMVSKGKIDFLTFAKAMDDAFGEHAKDANKTYAGSLSNVNAALSRIGADIKAAHFEDLRKIFVDLIPKLNEFKKAFKPIEDLIIETEQALGELIQKVISMVDVTKTVKDTIPTVRKIGTSIKNAIKVVSLALGEVDKPLTTVENLGKKAFFASARMKQLTSEADRVKEALSSAGASTNKFTKELEAAKEIWNKGTYGNGQQRIDALTAAGIDPKKTQAIIDAFISSGYDWDKAIEKVSSETGDAFDENSEKAEKLKKHVKTLAAIFTNIKRVIKNVAVSVGNVLKVLISVITGNLEKIHLGDTLIDITGAIADLSDRFLITEERAEKLRKPLQIIVDICKAIISAIITVAKAIVIAIINIGKFIGFIVSKIHDTAEFTDAVDEMGNSFTKSKNKIKDFIDSVKNSERVKKFFEDIGEIATTVVTTITAVVTVATNAIIKFATKVKTIASKVYSFLKPFLDILWNIAKAITGVIRYLYTNIKEGNLFDDIKAKIAELTNKGGAAKAAGGVLLNIIGWVEEFFSTIANAIKKLTLADVIKILKDSAMLYAIAKVVIMIKAINKLTFQVPKLLTNISKMMSSTAKVNKSIARLNTANSIYAIMKAVLSFSISIAIIIGSIITVADYLKKGEKAKEAFREAVKTVTDLILAVGVIIGAIITLSKLLDLASAVFTSRARLHIPFFLQIGVFIYSIGSTIKNVIRSIVTLGNMDADILDMGLERLRGILINIGGYALIMFALMGVIQNIFRFKEMPSMFIQLSILLLAVSASITLLVIPIAIIAGLEKVLGEDKVDMAITGILTILKTIGILLSAILLFSAVLTAVGTHSDIGKMFLGAAAVFIAIGIGMNFLVTSLMMMFAAYKIDTEKMLATVFSLIGIIATVALMLTKTAATNNVRYTNQMWAIVGIFISLGLLVRFMQALASSIKDENQVIAVGIVLLGLVGIVEAFQGLMKAIGEAKPNSKPVKSLIGVFLSLAGILVPLMFFQDKNEFDVAAIGVAMLGLVLVVHAMARVVEAVGTAKPNKWALLSLAAVFGSLALILLPLQKLSSEDWLGYLVALGGLSAVIFAVSTALKALSATTTAGKILAVGGSIAMVTAVLAGLAAVLTWASNVVDPDRLAAITVSLLLLSVALGGLVVIAAKFPLAIPAVLSFAASLVIIAGAVGIVAFAIGYLINKFPEFEHALYSFVYFVGQIPRILVGSLIGKSKEELGIASPSKAFAEIGMYCIEGLFLGMFETLKNGVSKIGDALKEYIIDPVCDFLGINSPSIVFDQIGDFMGQGLQNGFTNSIKNFDLHDVASLGESITSALPDGTNIGEMLGVDIKSGIVDGLSFDDFEGFDGFGDITNGTNITELGDALGMDLSGAIVQTAEEEGRKIDWTQVYHLEDLINDPTKYDYLKSVGEQQLTAAYEDWQRHAEFMANNPTYKAYLDNIETNFGADFAERYREIQASGNDAMKEELDKYLLGTYIDQTKLDKATFDLMSKVKTSIDGSTEKVFSDRHYANIAHVVSEQLKVKDKLEGDARDARNEARMKLIMSVEDDEGNILTNGVQSFLKDGTSYLNVDYDNSSVKTNMDAVSSDISSVVNAQGDKLAQKLEFINNRVNEFDTNQMNRTNSLLSRISQMEDAISRIQVYLDTGALVGQLVDPMDEALGGRSRRKARG